MRTEDRNDNAMVKALGSNQQSTILCSSGTPRDSNGNKAITVAVTTAPRKDCTLAYCLASIEACGWTPIVFAEPGSTETDYQTITNPVKLGIWHNWLNACRWCLENSSSQYIMTVQDDSLFHPDCKACGCTRLAKESCVRIPLHSKALFPRQAGWYQSDLHQEPLGRLCSDLGPGSTQESNRNTDVQELGRR